MAVFNKQQIISSVTENGETGSDTMLVKGKIVQQFREIL